MRFKVPVLPGEYVYAIPDFDMIEKRIIVEGVVEKNFVVDLSENPIVIFCVKGFNVVSERDATRQRTKQKQHLRVTRMVAQFFQIETLAKQ